MKLRRRLLGMLGMLATLAIVLASCATSEEPDVVTGPAAEGSIGSEASIPFAQDADTADESGDAADGGSGAAADSAAPSTSVPADDPAEEPDADADDGSGATENESAEALPGTLRAGLLADALDPDNALLSARFEGDIEMEGAPGSDLPGTVALSFSGAFDLAADASHLEMDLSDLMEAAMAAEDGSAVELSFFADMFDEPLEIITIGDTSWVKWGLLALFTGAEDKWLEGEADGANDLAGGIGFGSGSPTAVLDLLADAQADVETVGTEELRGVLTTHYRAVIDPVAMAAALTPEEAAEFTSELGATPIEAFPMEFWLDEAGLIHRYLIDLSDPSAFDDGEELLSARIVFEMWDHGEPVDIVPPPADQVVTEDDIDFGFDDLGAFSG